MWFKSSGFVFLLCMCLCAGKTVAGNYDSLKQVLAHTTDDKHRLHILTVIIRADLFADNPERDAQLSEAVALADKLGDRRTAASLYQISGSRTEYYDNPNKALELYLHATQLFEAAGDELQVAALSQRIGIIYRNSKRYDKAATIFAKALSLYKQQHNRTGEASVLNDLGILHQAVGDNTKAMQVYKEALALHSSDVTEDKAYILENIAGIYADSGQYGQARQYYHNALTIRNSHGNMRAVAYVYYYIGSMNSRQKYYPEAEKSFLLAASIGKNHHASALLAACYDSLAAVYRATDKLELARNYMTQADSVRIVVEKGKKGQIILPEDNQKREAEEKQLILARDKRIVAGFCIVLTLLIIAALYIFSRKR